MAISSVINNSAQSYIADDKSVNVFGDRSRLEDPEATQAEMAILIVIGTIGMLANFSIIVVIMVLQNLRKASNAFLVHHCILDFIKAGYCLPFAQTMVTDQLPLFCSLLGGSYIVFVTTTAFNLLAVVMNEAYLFSDLTLGVKDSRNYCCVIFGVFIIWFSSIIMNLGVAFIPGNPSYDRRIGHCIFVYGITRNYVLHMLWIVLISMGLGLTCMYLHKFRADIKRVSYYRLNTLIRATVTIDPKVITRPQREAHEEAEKHHVKFLQRITHRKLVLLIMVVSLFVIFWYPLFILTAVDPNFSAPSQLYKVMTMFAWSNPSISPFIFMFFIKQACCCRETEDDLTAFDENLDALETSRASVGSVHRSSTVATLDNAISDNDETKRLNEALPTTSNCTRPRRFSLGDGDAPRCSIGGPVLSEDDLQRSCTRNLLPTEYSMTWK